MKIVKNKYGTYETTAYKNGKRKHIVASSYAECKDKALDWLNSKEMLAPSRLSVRNAIEQYISLNGSVLSPTTIRSYQSVMRNYFQSIMDMPIERLTSQQIQKAINDECKKVSPKTIKNAYGVLSVALKQYNVEYKNINLPQKIKNDIYIPTKDEIKKLIDNSSGTLHDAIVLGAYLGLRRSEICALQPNDIDKNVIHIRKAMVKGLNGWEIKTTKTYESSRDLPLPKSCKSVELPIKAYPNTITEEFDRLRDKLKVPIRFHDLRHYFVSTLIANNVPNAYIRSCTGHSTDNMINSVYGHILPEKKKEVALIMERAFE